MKNHLFAIVLFVVLIDGYANSIKTDIFISATEIISDDFKKVDSSELTPPIIEEILKQYPTSKLAGVYKNDKNQFKLIMVLKSGTRRTVYIDSYGRWFKLK
ncbi:hypothetical protein [Croceitalea rosinachiae]|uniref:Beta-lactamase-inhibitor-like PepSY-like domain-containing protein n=1 Tax=Croceitalea rosinachiae TaxID=3075596 RepID=A0ABU3A9X1_9FLAO|nr:hypothetical protein [Croceitalea sp. F388]MDT0606605.1 hypothetical protein [Croceitalea sp. F388]